jgi:hypothetical protein
MVYDTHRRKTVHNFYQRNVLSKHKQKLSSRNEVKTAFEDKKRLKKIRKRLSLDWFFRPEE